jgi:hypothetical protein
MGIDILRCLDATQSRACARLQNSRQAGEKYKAGKTNAKDRLAGKKLLPKAKNIKKFDIDRKREKNRI